jgi:hypothetical protein
MEEVPQRGETILLHVKERVRRNCCCMHVTEEKEIN